MRWIQAQVSCLENQWFSASRYKKFKMFLGVYTVLFLITFLLAYSPFWLAKKSFIWTSDGRAVHYPALVYIGRYFRQIILNLLQGKFAIPLFDLSIGTGNDIISTLNYVGFGDPLNILAAFVPTKYIECLYNFLVILRPYLAGLAFSMLCIYHRKRIAYTLIGSLVYVFSGYIFFHGIRDIFFSNPMIQLPLILIGIDLLIKKRSPILFCLSIFYSALCGFYFLYMMTIISGIYTLIRFFGLFQTNRIREFIRMIGRITAVYLLGIGLSATIFVPAICGFFLSSRFGEMITRNYLFWGIDYCRNSLLGVIAPKGDNDALTMAAIVLPAIVLLLFSHRTKNHSLKLMFLAAILFYIFPLGGYIMNGFGYPSQRWIFSISLLFSYILVDKLPVLLAMDRRQSLVCFCVLVVYSTCVFISPKNRNVYYVVGVVMLAFTLLVLLLFNKAAFPSNYKKGQASINRVAISACILLVIGNVSINAVYRFSKDQGNVINAFTKYGAETERLETAMEREAEPFLKYHDGRFSSSMVWQNLASIWHVPTDQVYQNLINVNSTIFWEKTENIQQRQQTYRIQGTDQRARMGALLSIKYLIEPESRSQYVPYGYELLQTTEKGNQIYLNEYALPWGYTYDKVISYEMLEPLNGLEREEAMLQAIALDEGFIGNSISPIDSNIKEIPYEIKKISNAEWKDGILKVKKADAVITLEFQVPAQTEGYIRLQGFNINGSGQRRFNVSIICNDIDKTAVATSVNDNWYFGREDYLCNLGYSGEVRTTCTITFPVKGTFYLEDIQLFSLSMDKFPEQVEKLRAEPLKNIKFDTNMISGTVDLSCNKVLCMSIPYSAGWTAKVDGKQANILRGNYMFMALPLEKGHHEIEFTYSTPGLQLGVIISIVSLGISIFWIVNKRRNNLVRFKAQ